MTGLGTMVNVSAIVAGGVLGWAGGRLFSERMQQTLLQGSAVAVIFIGIAGTLSKMLIVTPDGIETTGVMMMIVSLALGAIIGEILDIDGKVEKFGEYLKKKSGSSKDTGFVNAFVTASLTVCIGAMAVIGAIEDSLQGNYTILFAKSLLDFIIIAIMAASMGKGCAFSAIPVGLFQGSITALAAFLAPYITDGGMYNLSYVGNILIFCVGLNLLFPKTIRVANLLPSIFIACLLDGII